MNLGTHSTKVLKTSTYIVKQLAKNGDNRCAEMQEWFQLIGILIIAPTPFQLNDILIIARMVHIKDYSGKEWNDPSQYH